MDSLVRVVSEETDRKLGEFIGDRKQIEGNVSGRERDMEEHDQQFSARAALDVTSEHPKLLTMEQMAYLSRKIRDQGIIKTAPSLISESICRLQRTSRQAGRYGYDLYLYPERHVLSCKSGKVLCGAQPGCPEENEKLCVHPEDIALCGTAMTPEERKDNEMTPALRKKVQGAKRVRQKLSETSSALQDAARSGALEAAKMAYNALNVNVSFLAAVARNLMKEDPSPVLEPDEASGEDAEHTEHTVPALPPPEDEVWRDPVKKMELLQGYLYEKYAYGTAIAEDGPEACRELKSKPQLQLFQRAAAEPLKYVSNMLVVASTGSGKSFLWTAIARSIHDQMILQNMQPRITIIVKSDALRQEQYAELVNSPAWSDLSPGPDSLVEDYVPTEKALAWKQHVASNDDRSNRAIRFLTFHQAGNTIVKATKDRRSMDGDAILMDEVHVLADPASGRNAVNAFFDWLQERKYYKLVGLTATPFVNMPSFVHLLRLFQPVDAAPVTEDEMSHLFPPMRLPEKGEDDRGTADDRAMLEGAKSCDIVMDGLRYVAPNADEKLYDRLRGYNIYMYSTDRDYDVYPFVHIDEEKCFLIRSRSAKNDKMHTKREDGRAWTRSGLRHSHRSKMIADQLAEDLGKYLLSEAAVGKKGLVMLTTPSQTDNFVESLRKRHPSIDRQYDVMAMSAKLFSGTKSGRMRARAILAEFNSSPTGRDDLPRLLIADADTWGTGINMLGVRQFHRLPASTLKEDVQIRGRVKRFCGHDKYQDVKDWQVEMYLWIPQAERKLKDGTPKCSCERVMTRVVQRAQRFEESLYRALFMVSFGRMAFWERRPIFVDTESVSDDEDETYEDHSEEEEEETTIDWVKRTTSAAARGIWDRMRHAADVTHKHKNRLRDALAAGFSIGEEDMLLPTLETA